MQTRFIEYLTALKSSSSKINSESKKELPAGLIPNVKDCVYHATENSLIGELGRVFNEFPRQFSIGDKTYSAIDDLIWTRWIDTCKGIVLGGTRIERDLEEPGKFVLDEKSKKSLEQLVTDITAQGVDEILDEDGNIKQELIDFLGLQPLVDRFQELPNKLLLIKQQLLFAYCSQLVLANAVNPLNRAKSADVEKIQIIMLAAQCLLTDPKTVRFTSFFQKIIERSLNHKFYKQSLHDQFVDRLENAIPVMTYSMVTMDLQQRSHVNREERLRFWLTVMDSCRQRKFYSQMRAIYNALPTNDELLNNEDCLHCNNTMEQKQDIDMQQEEDKTSELLKLLHARDNTYLIRFLLNHKCCALTLEEKAFLRGFIADRDLIQEEPAKVLGIINTVWQQSGDYNSKFQAAFDEAHRFFDSGLGQHSVFAHTDTQPFSPNISKKPQGPAGGR